MKINLTKTLLATSIALTLGTTGAEAALVTGVLGATTWSTDSANFGFLDSNGGAFGITNDLTMLWDGNAYNSSSDYAGPGGVANVTASSTTAFLGNSSTIHDIQMFTPGTYAFDTALGGGNPETGIMGATIGAGQLGMHLLFDWKGNLNIDMLMVFDQNSVFGSGVVTSSSDTCLTSYTGTVTKNCVYDGPNYGGDGAPINDQLWMLASTDPDGDGVMGIPMALGGPLQFFSAVINVNLNAPELAPVPLPAAAWLLWSGLLGLVSVVRRRKGAGSDIHSG